MPSAALPLETRRLFLRVNGIVQGVGFRPFVSRCATARQLTGHVENTTRGVEIEVQGSAARVEAFAAALLEAPPPMARVLSCTREDRAPLAPGRETGFAIRASRTDPVSAVMVPPDIATCPACLAELNDPADRRHRYPFTNCTDCGPRYSIIHTAPYDRARTSMAAFAMCPRCAAEYLDPTSRRFHAQPNACPTCGPRLALLDAAGEPLPEETDPLGAAAAWLVDGGIVAVLGLGGFHLACDATCQAAVDRLRQRKARPAKPLAVMVGDLAAARRLATVDATGAALLTSPQAPIVLLPSCPDSALASAVAPGQDRVGVFLPTTPLHHLLCAAVAGRPLVMTSGNRSDEPMLATLAQARDRLAGVADAYLTHDRSVVHRVDDSVVKTMGAAEPLVLRRARGYAPGPLPLGNPDGRVVLALGAELANAVCVVHGDHAFLGPHVGDLKNLEVEGVFREGVGHLLRLLRVEPDLVVCDLHPRYRSSVFANHWVERGCQRVVVQHHEAHAAACLAEHGFGGDAVVLALDGLGYGHDGTLWGGEILVGRPGGFRRAAHLLPVPQPGGDQGAREPWRMAASHLRSALGPDWANLPLPALADHPPADLQLLDAAMERGLNSPFTSSCGRLFDAAAAILGFRGAHRYSAQAPMELEAMAAACSEEPAAYPALPPVEQEGRLVLQPAGLVRGLLDDVLAGRDRTTCARAFHRGLARLFADAAARVAADRGLAHVFLTGGCLQNAVFAGDLSAELHPHRLTVHCHREVPPNDGGVAFGQAAWALAAARRTL
ncbi:MAG: carbamoyltransferase HypF [Deferrisomatales bacterium]|nr:carbamoyltransferase HypF [Deferrisomatales bacterium]